jgi:DNA-binding SARP family transcriptional activator
MNRYSLYLLGPPRLERDGKPVEFDTRKATALLAYMALARASHSRDTLAALLYPESDQTKARASLRRTLSTLKQALGEEYLEIDRETIGLNPAAGLRVDVDLFSGYLGKCKELEHETPDACHGCIKLLESTVEIYHGDFMAGFTLRDSPQFDDWQFFQAESLRRALVDALGRLVCCHSIQGEYERALEHTRRWLAIDPLDEPAHRQLMRLYAWTGQRTAALRQYRECVRMLQQELSVAPLEETTHLYEEIEANRVRAPRVEAERAADPALSGRVATSADSLNAIDRPSPPAPRPSFPSSPYPLVGRSEELKTLLNIYGAIRTDGRLVILEGEAGIGKTRLAGEFLGEVQRRGAAVVAARSFEGETNLAYGPFVEALRAFDPQSSRLERIPAQVLGEAARLMPELAQRPGVSPSSGPLNSPGAQSRFLESVSQVLLATCAGDPPGVLFLDDVQWSDTASLDLLTFLARRLRGRPLLLLAAWRSEQVGTGHRLRRLLAELQRAGTATLIHLSRLDRDAVADLVRAAQGGATQDLAERLYRETEGQPFFLVEYLALLGSGEGTESAEWFLPGGVRDLLRSHLNRVSETAQQLLGAAAVIGRSFDFDTLREAGGRNELETITALEELTAQGLISEAKTSGGGLGLTFDFSHEKLRALVYEGTSLARRRLLHRRVAEALVNRARLHRETDRLANQIARHYQLAGEESLAAEYFRRAGEYARSLFANSDALEHFRAALALGYPDATWLHEAIGDLQTLTGDYTAALNSYESAAARLGPGEGGSVEAKIAGVYLRRGDWELAEQHFQAALAMLGESHSADVLARIYGDWSLAALHRDSGDQARDLANQSLQIAEAAGDRRALAEAHNILGILARHEGDLDQALTHLEESLALAETLGDPDVRAAALNNLALLCRDRDDLARGLEFAQEALSLISSQGDRHRLAALHNNLADLLHAAGKAEEAMAHLKQAVAIYAEIGGEGEMWQPEIWKLTEW